MNRTFIEVPMFTKKWNELKLNDEILKDLQNILLNDPKSGNVIQGTGGLRKIRIPMKNKGKSSGSRVIYIDIELKKTIYFLNVYSKNEKDNLTDDEKKALKTMVKILKEDLMMKLKELQDAMIAAMKAKDKFRKEAIAALVSAVKKAGIDAGCRENIPDEMADQAILKEIKAVKEQIDTCPADRTELLEEYRKRYEIMNEFAPQLLSAEEVKAILQEKFSDLLATKDKGQIMKAVMAELKGKADGKVINQTVAEMIK